jgi:hypothetical protein
MDQVFIMVTWGMVKNGALTPLLSNNRHLRLTCDTWGKIEEPICFYKKIFCDLPFANWNDVKFEVVSDITGIVMKLD